MHALWPLSGSWRQGGEPPGGGAEAADKAAARHLLSAGCSASMVYCPLCLSSMAVPKFDLPRTHALTGRVVTIFRFSGADSVHGARTSRKIAQIRLVSAPFRAQIRRIELETGHGRAP